MRGTSPLHRNFKTFPFDAGHQSEHIFRTAAVSYICIVIAVNLAVIVLVLEQRVAGLRRAILDWKQRLAVLVRKKIAFSVEI